ncbi:P-loop containing nucleoside triphosphate hydrolase protein [Jimgerdemannia flammicorona]|uniref:P-loop containing nucleoside triphosphate hydrolase protein n=1 Tax=Jimgerdemannia flammicorona TaxID=994334 RepID=A0A433AUI5_9FUNG|nr:P-loop containing nucleoside triphosphate hydrolase protein [Jimgerdemannia flammicorona]
MFDHRIALRLGYKGADPRSGGTCHAWFRRDRSTSPLVVTAGHFNRALIIVRPSNFHEFQTKIPNVRFSELFGIDDIIEEIKTSVIYPFHHPQDFVRLGIAPPRGILVYGPPGVGKTMLCCALAAEAGINFMLVESSQVRSKVVGESEKNIARMFAQAKANSPCILFIDQIDILIPKRGTSVTSENTGDRIVTGFLTEMDGFFSKTSAQTDPQIDVLVVAATNRPDVIDPAILRPGRLDEHVCIPAPDVKQRTQILRGLCTRMPIALTLDEIEQLAADMDGCSGADLDNLCREAALISIRENMANDKPPQQRPASQQTNFLAEHD